MTATPWTRRTLTVTALMAAAGCVLWAVGWYRTAGEPASNEQIAWLNLAIVGLALVGVGYAQWFLAGRRAVGVRRRLLLTPPVAPGDGHLSPTVRVLDFYVGAERFFHHTDCPMVEDRGWRPTSKDEHLRSGRVACGVCAP